MKNTYIWLAATGVVSTSIYLASHGSKDAPISQIIESTVTRSAETVSPF